MDPMLKAVFGPESSSSSESEEEEEKVSERRGALDAALAAGIVQRADAGMRIALYDQFRKIPPDECIGCRRYGLQRHNQDAQSEILYDKKDFILEVLKEIHADLGPATNLASFMEVYKKLVIEQMRKVENTKLIPLGRDLYIMSGMMAGVLRADEEYRSHLKQVARFEMHNFHQEAETYLINETTKEIERRQAEKRKAADDEQALRKMMEDEERRREEEELDEAMEAEQNAIIEQSLFDIQKFYHLLQNGVPQEKAHAICMEDAREYRIAREQFLEPVSSPPRSEYGGDEEEIELDLERIRLDDELNVHAQSSADTPLTMARCLELVRERGIRLENFEDDYDDDVEMTPVEYDEEEERRRYEEEQAARLPWVYTGEEEQYERQHWEYVPPNNGAEAPTDAHDVRQPQEWEGHSLVQAIFDVDDSDEETEAEDRHLREMEERREVGAPSSLLDLAPLSPPPEHRRPGSPSHAARAAAAAALSSAAPAAISHRPSDPRKSSSSSRAETQEVLEVSERQAAATSQRPSDPRMSRSRSSRNETYELLEASEQQAAAADADAATSYLPSDPRKLRSRSRTETQDVLEVSERHAAAAASQRPSDPRSARSCTRRETRELEAPEQQAAATVPAATSSAAPAASRRPSDPRRTRTSSRCDTMEDAEMAEVSQREAAVAAPAALAASSAAAAPAAPAVAQRPPDPRRACSRTKTREALAEDAEMAAVPTRHHRVIRPREPSPSPPVHRVDQEPLIQGIGRAVAVPEPIGDVDDEVLPPEKYIEKYKQPLQFPQMREMIEQRQMGEERRLERKVRRPAPKSYTSTRGAKNLRKLLTTEELQATYERAPRVNFGVRPRGNKSAMKHPKRGQPVLLTDLVADKLIIDPADKAAVDARTTLVDIQRMNAEEPKKKVRFCDAEDPRNTMRLYFMAASAEPKDPEQKFDHADDGYDIYRKDMPLTCMKEILVETVKQNEKYPPPKSADPTVVGNKLYHRQATMWNRAVAGSCTHDPDRRTSHNVYRAGPIAIPLRRRQDRIYTRATALMRRGDERKEEYTELEVSHRNYKIIRAIKPMLDKQIEKAWLPQLRLYLREAFECGFSRKLGTPRKIRSVANSGLSHLVFTDSLLDRVNTLRFPQTFFAIHQHPLNLSSSFRVLCNEVPLAKLLNIECFIFAYGFDEIIFQQQSPRTVAENVMHHVLAFEKLYFMALNLLRSRRRGPHAIARFCVFKLPLKGMDERIVPRIKSFNAQLENFAEYFKSEAEKENLDSYLPFHFKILEWETPEIVKETMELGDSELKERGRRGYRYNCIDSFARAAHFHCKMRTARKIRPGDREEFHHKRMQVDAPGLSKEDHDRIY